MKEKIKQFLVEIGFDANLIDSEHFNDVDKWLKMYKGKTAQHEYYTYNGLNKVKQEIKSLQLAYKSCNDLSDFFFNEKMEITTDSEQFNEILSDVFEQNKFLSNANKLLQRVKALGDGAIVCYLDNNVLKMNFLNATNIVILDADTTGVNSVLFYNDDGKKLVINAHVLKEDGYTIYNREYKKYNGTYGENLLDDEVSTIETKSFVPKFAMLYGPEDNNQDLNSPYHLSVYANSYDNLIAIDRAYDSYDNEIWLGRKRIYVKGGAINFNTDNQGNTTPVFDSSETVYHQLPGDEKSPLITIDDSELRIDQLGNALQAQINLYTSSVGLGHNYYKFKDGEVYVNADNVISTNSDIYRKIRKQENILTNALTTMCYAIADLLKFDGAFKVSIDYDDSIIEDTEGIKKQAMTEYNADLISKAEYYRQVYKLKDKAAVDFANQMNEEIVKESITDGSEFNLGE